MLTCYGHTSRLPAGDLTYAAFRIAAMANLEDLRLLHVFHDDIPEEELTPFLDVVPILAPIDRLIQISLLGETWAKQRRREFVEADLLDAALVYAACVNATETFRHSLDVAKLDIEQGPRRVRLRLTQNTAERFFPLFESFWDDEDFLMIEAWQDLPPRESQALKDQMQVPDEPLYDALGRGRLSPTLRADLRGLLTPSEINECFEFARIRRIAV